MTFRIPLSSFVDQTARNAAAAAQSTANSANSAAAAAQSTANAAQAAANNITTTQITDGAISTPKLAAGAITAGKIAAGAVQAGTIAAGAIDGQTITGATVRTANPATAPAMQLYEASDANGRWGVLEADDPAADAPGALTMRLNAGAGGSIQGALTMLKGIASNGKTPPELDLATEAAPSSGYNTVIRPKADRLDLGSVSSLGNLIRYAGSWNGSGSLGAVLNGIGKTPTDQPELIVQFWNGTLTSSAFGDSTIFFPVQPSAWLWFGCTTPGIDDANWWGRNPRSNALDVRLANGAGSTLTNTTRQLSAVMLGIR